MSNIELLLVFGVLIVLLIVAIALIVIGHRTLKHTTEELNEATAKAESLETDVKDLLKRALDAEQANVAKTNFITNMAIQLRTPLSTVIGMDEMLAAKVGISEEEKECTGNIYTASKMMEALIGDLIDLSKIEHNELFIDEEPYAIGEVIRHTYKLAKTYAKNPGIELNLEVDENIPRVLIGDENRLQQVLLNLLTNAISLTPIGKVSYHIGFEKKELPVEEGEEKVLAVELTFTIQDTGIGFKEEDMERVYSNFEKEMDYAEMVSDSTSLGLIVTNQILQLMKSHLQVESEYGQGSKVSFSLIQLVEDETPIGSKEEILKSEDSFQEEEDKGFIAPNVKVLAVDDNRMNLAVINGILKRTKMQVDCVGSGMECIEAVKKEHYHAILLDHMMPGMDGVATLRKLRKMEDNLSIDAPIIAITASASRGMRQYYLKRGFSDYVSKPIQVSKLFRVLSKVLPEEMVVRSDSYEEHIASEVIQIQETIQEENSEESQDLEAIKGKVEEIKVAMTDFKIEQAMNIFDSIDLEEVPESCKELMGEAFQQMKNENYEAVATALEKIANM